MLACLGADCGVDSLQHAGMEGSHDMVAVALCLLNAVPAHWTLQSLILLEVPAYSVRSNVKANHR